MNTEITIADYTDKAQAEDIVYLMDIYSRDAMGGSQSLPDSVKSNLVASLSKLPHAFSVICYVDNSPVGLINCFEAFSTFKCQPLVNIHDVIVIPEFRGKGLSHKMLSKVEEIAKNKGCCKLTLEVLEGNTVAQSAYVKFGFAGYELDPAMGKALFWQKNL